ncbi:hypothetical protein EPH95_10860 [Salicibibacter halophilus]|uniref:Alpha-L-glutamate ligase-related protein ATP-grasp domain-containing protein n=1 Tax=Salicibibacter halophilus TaxID=2502791 RepID=A0A514LIC2_9BACI|nr:sugar-transfer associated ATP-grasp domain-containing protein [Salicibibacter halophilus]QDI91603.1 hypothetical protein EPH95_10860 [Salicibibacter halophilus]
MGLNANTDLIIKPSKSNNGIGIRKLSVQDEKIYLEGKAVTIHQIEEIYIQNFLVQKAIQQHEILAAPHPYSVNTLRMVTFRWKNEIRYLLAFARFGSNNDIRDNAGAGSGTDVRVGVTDSGEFLNVAVSQHGQTYTHHPTTGYCFADLGFIPNFDEFKQFVKDCHKSILHLDFISWDIAMGSDGKPIFIEANFAGTTPFYQLAAQKPIFGDLTDEVLQYVKDELLKNKPILMRKDRIKLERKKSNEREKVLQQIKNKNSHFKKRNKKLKSALKSNENELIAKENELIAKENELLNKINEIDRIEENYKKLLYSKSWRYTRPFRYLLKLIKS